MRASIVRGEQERRGVVLLIVLGLLALFVTLGLTAALISKVVGQGARNYKRAFQERNPFVGGDIQDVELFFQFAINQLTDGTNRHNSAMRGHSLLRDMYGGWDDPATDDNNINTITDVEGAELRDNDPSTMPPWGYFGAFNGTGIPAARDATQGDPASFTINLGGGAVNPNLNPGTPDGRLTRADILYALSRFRVPKEFGPTFVPANQLDPIFPFNYTIFDNVPGTNQRVATPAVGPGAPPTDPQEPERFWVTGANEYHWFGFDEDYDAPDHNNWFLALERADGQILLPSFHRPHLVRQIELAAGIGQGQSWVQQEGRRFIFRPRRMDYDPTTIGWTPPVGVQLGQRWQEMSDPDGDGNPNDIDGSGFIGDAPSELDVDTDGDGLKDSIWIDLGYPPVQLVDGSWAKPLFAFKVTDLDGKINLNIAGNYHGDLDDDANTEFLGHPDRHVSNLGASPTEINPKWALLIDRANPDNNRPLWQDSVVYHDLFVGNNGVGAGTIGLGKYNPGNGTAPTEFDRAGTGNTAASNSNPIPMAAFGDDDNMSRLTEYAALQLHGPADFYGSGAMFEPFSDIAVSQSNRATTRRKHILGSYFNYGGSGSGFGRNDWTGNTQNQPINPATSFLGINEAYEFNPYLAAGASSDNPFTAAQIERLLRFYDIDSSILANRIASLLPASFGDQDQVVDTQSLKRAYARNRMRHLFTSLSWDLCHYSANPAYANPASTELSATGGTETPEDRALYFQGNPIHVGNRQHHGTMAGFVYDTTAIGNFLNPTPSLSMPVPQPNDFLFQVKDFGNVTPGLAYGRRLPLSVANGRRFDLNRPLAAYPTAGADEQRTAMAEQIYVLLWLSVHPKTDGTPEAQAQARVLAQLAVNIVDYIDPDNVMTRMVFDNNLEDGMGWDASPPQAATLGTNGENTVMGFELPQLVINEAAATVFPYDPGMMAAPRDKYWVWAELYNPWPADANGSDPLAVDLVGTGDPARSAFLLGWRVVDSSGSAVLGNQAPGQNISSAFFVDFHTANVGTEATIPPTGTIVGAGQYYVVGNEGTTGAMGMPPEPDTLLPNWTQPMGMVNGSNDFTANDFKNDFPQDANNRDVAVTLYRLRNQFAPYDATTNPYIGLDHIQLKNSNTGGGSDEGSYTIDLDPSMAVAPGDRKTMQRRQPWHGFKAPFDPDHGGPLQMGAPPNEYVEGKYLGFPDLTNPANNQLINNGFEKGDDNFQNANPNELGVFASFPFLNRPLASPMELLSVRLYGSHLWNVGINEWRLRFTDDFEYVPSGNYPTTPGFWRSRQVPWFLNNRDTHPMNGTTFSSFTGEFPAFPNTAIMLEPFAHLHRFFEFVECRSKLRGAGGLATATPFDSGIDGQSPPQDVREPRVAGKINVNTMTDEEVFKALLDVEEAISGDSTYRPTGYDTLKQTRLTTRLGAAPGANLLLQHVLFWDDLWTSNCDTYLNPMPIDFGGSLTAHNNVFGVNGALTVPISINGTYNRHLQWPGIESAGPTSGDYPGYNDIEQVSSEFFRMFILNRAGADGILGSADDKPFRGFAATRLADTILRRRNHRLLDLPVHDRNDGDQFDDTSDGDVRRGEFVAELGGQWTPRLFEGVDNPYDVDPAGELFIRAGVDPNAADIQALNSDPNLRADYWMAENQRNRILSKIANNVTTRSNVFAVWLSVGLFRVQEGTETFEVPLLNEEIGGQQQGRTVRHRGFFIIDRSLVRSYSGPTDTNGGPANQGTPLRQIAPLVHFRIIE